MLVIVVMSNSVGRWLTKTLIEEAALLQEEEVPPQITTCPIAVQT